MKLKDTKGRWPKELRDIYPPYSVIALENSIKEQALTIQEIEKAKKKITNIKNESNKIIKESTDPLKITNAKVALKDCEKREKDFNDEIERQELLRSEMLIYLPKCKKRDEELAKLGIAPL